MATKATASKPKALSSGAKVKKKKHALWGPAAIRSTTVNDGPPVNPATLRANITETTKFDITLATGMSNTLTVTGVGTGLGGNVTGTLSGLDQNMSLATLCVPGGFANQRWTLLFNNPNVPIPLLPGPGVPSPGTYKVSLIVTTTGGGGPVDIIPFTIML